MSDQLHQDLFIYNHVVSPLPAAACKSVDNGDFHQYKYDKTINVDDHRFLGMRVKESPAEASVAKNGLPWAMPPISLVIFPST